MPRSSVVGSRARAGLGAMCLLVAAGAVWAGGPDIALAPGATLAAIARATTPTPFVHFRHPTYKRVVASCHGWNPLRCQFADSKGTVLAGAKIVSDSNHAVVYMTGRGECEGDGRILPGKTIEIKSQIIRDDEVPGGVTLGYSCRDTSQK